MSGKSTRRIIRRNISMRMQASYTVENSFIIPLFVILIVQLLCLSFYIHDVVILKSSALKIAIRVEGLIDKNGDGSILQTGTLDEKNTETAEEISRLRLGAEEYIRGKSICTDNINVQIENNNKKIIVICTGEFPLLPGIIRKFEYLKESAAIDENKPDDFIRTVNALEDVVR